MKQLYYISALFLSILFCSCKKTYNNIVFETQLSENWSVQTSANVAEKGEQISMPAFNSQQWYQTTVPSTVLNTLVKNGVYSDVFFSNNLEKIPTEQFKVSWWYRTEFEIDAQNTNCNYQLVFEGLNYRANIWLNGSLIAASDTTEGSFRIFKINLDTHTVSEKNALAVEIFPPSPTDLTIGFVDWNPWAPDNNMGIWRGVKLLCSKAISLQNVFVQTTFNDETFTTAKLQITADLVNLSDTEVETEIEGKIENIKFSQKYTLAAREHKIINFTPENVKELTLKSPRLWYPNNLGEPNLYELELCAKVDEEISDIKKERFGIRKVEQYINNEGHKGYRINGKKVLIKGAGWVDDLMLADSDEKVEAQIKYAKHMNLNTIRLEGFWGNNKTIYEKADEHGILLMIGWSCHWEWTGYCGRPETEFMCISSPEDIDLQSKAYIDQVVWLRNHPSIFLWVFGSDKLPTPELEQKLTDYMKIADPSRPILGCCKYQDFGTNHFNISKISGPTAVKMLGPYAYVTPNYWYIDTIAGGAYGFNTETGPGPQVPPLESIKKMIPQENLWPIDTIWNYHLGRNEFQTLNRYLAAFNARYGEAQSVEEFAFKSQVSNYEAIRGMFEAFAANKYKSTGVIQWMLNSAWPEMFWQLYDWYLMPNGAFYGTKTACQPLSLIYNYKNKNIYLSNDYNRDYTNLQAEIRVFDINSKEVFSENVKVDISETESKQIFEMPSLTNISTTYFIDLRLKGNDATEISRNFYWLSTKDDVPDFEKTEWHCTPYKSYGDFNLLNTMAKAEVVVNHHFENKGEETEITVEIENKSEVIAFFIEFQLINENTNQSILPIFWNDNYISLLPHEKRTLSASFSTKTNSNIKPKFAYKGMNVN